MATTENPLEYLTSEELDEPTSEDLEQTKSRVSALLERWRHGDGAAADELLPLVYQELRQAASSCMRRERVGHTLNTTDLIHEAYLRLFSADALDVEGRGHFLAVATRVMHRVLVDYARRQMAEKRLGPQQRLPIEEGLVVSTDRPEYVVQVDEALEEFRVLYPERAQVVELRFFGGFSESEIAEITGKSRTTVSRDWRFARLWLHKHISDKQDESEPQDEES